MGTYRTYNFQIKEDEDRKELLELLDGIMGIYKDDIKHLNRDKK